MQTLKKRERSNPFSNCERQHVLRALTLTAVLTFKISFESHYHAYVRYKVYFNFIIKLQIFPGRAEHEVPVLVKASASLILRFVPVMPTNMFDTRIHPCVRKNYPSKWTPRPSEIGVWCPSNSSDHTSGFIRQTGQRSKIIHVKSFGAV